MTKLLIKMFRRILKVDVMPLEMMTSVLSVIWGIWMLLPIDTFSASSTYSVMAVLLPEYVWGIAFLLIGLLQIISMHSGKYQFRGCMATVVFAAWLFVDIGFWLSGSSSAAAVTYVMFVLAAMWSVVSILISRVLS